MLRTALPWSLLLFTSAVLGAAPRPPAIPTAKTWVPTLKRAPARSFSMGSLQLTFEATTLAQVLHAAGLGSIAHRGDASDSTYWLCYTINNANGTDRLWIVADGEMGGPRHTVSRVSARRMPGVRPTPDCPVLPTSLQPLSLNNALWLGSDDHALEKLLGAPSYRTGPWRAYQYQGRRPGKCDGGFDVLNAISTQSENGQLIAIDASQVTSC